VDLMVSYFGDMAVAKRSHSSLTLLALSLGSLSYAVLSSAVIPALPTIQHDLHTTETGVAWLLTAYLLAASVGTSIIGRLGDMYGKERLLLYTLLLLCVGGGIRIVASGVIVEHRNYHWLFWIPLAVSALAAVFTWRFVPESPVRAPGRLLAATLVPWQACGSRARGRRAGTAGKGSRVKPASCRHT
jgi:MFS family permease